MRERLDQIFSQARKEIETADSMQALNAVRVKFLGKKGALTEIMKGMGKLPADERPVVGQLANKVRNNIEAFLGQTLDRIKKNQQGARLAEEKIDITLPGISQATGRKHPLTTVLREIEDIFLGLGFSIAEGPEIELDYYNFEALNLPKDHPARDMQDTFFINEQVLLRTHTSPVQVRVMEQKAPELPVKIICPGKVYRRDDDATHSPMFNQVEGLAVDRHITFGDLKGVLGIFAREMFGSATKTRFRPSYFPFTEPSAEVDISCCICGGKGCRVCSQSGWIEVLGCGMVHPRVFEMSGYSKEDVTGFAFGMGLERIAMLKYGINDLRMFFENDLRFLSQF